MSNLVLVFLLFTVFNLFWIGVLVSSLFWCNKPDFKNESKTESCCSKSCK